MSARMIHGDARALPLDDDSVDCIVTSPPYNLNMPYEGVSDSYYVSEYEQLAAEAAAEMFRVTKPGGRLWLNCMHAMTEFSSIEALRQGTASKTGRRWNGAELWRSALLNGGFYYRDTVAWIQVGAHDAETAWGSMLSPNAPNLRGRWEPVLLMFKGTWDRGRVEKNEITWDEFSRWTRNVWEIPTAPRTDHPAPFPAEIPRRALLLSTWAGDTVLDPFAGSGTTVRVAHELGRHGVGVELSAEYVRRWYERGLQGVFDAATL